MTNAIKRVYLYHHRWQSRTTRQLQTTKRTTPTGECEQLKRVGLERIYSIELYLYVYRITCGKHQRQVAGRALARVRVNIVRFACDGCVRPFRGNKQETQTLDDSTWFSNRVLYCGFFIDVIDFVVWPPCAELLFHCCPPCALLWFPPRHARTYVIQPCADVSVVTPALFILFYFDGI